MGFKSNEYQAFCYKLLYQSLVCTAAKKSDSSPLGSGIQYVCPQSQISFVTFINKTCTVCAAKGWDVQGLVATELCLCSLQMVFSDLSDDLQLAQRQFVTGCLG